jgi:hypothetical protein
MLIAPCQFLVSQDLVRFELGKREFLGKKIKILTYGLESNSTKLDSYFSELESNFTELDSNFES